MDNLLKESEIRKLLTEEGLITISKASFSDLIASGTVPIAKKVGIKNRKMFIYEDVKQAIISSE